MNNITCSLATGNESSGKTALSSSKKARKRNIFSIGVIAVLAIFVMIVLFLVEETMLIMSEQGTLVSVDNPANTVNLAKSDFSCLAKDIGNHNYYTNTAKIVIQANDRLDESITVRLWNIEDRNESILLSHLDNEHRTCIFTHLSNQTYYSITVDKMPDLNITVRSRLTFWEAFSLVLQNK